MILELVDLAISIHHHGRTLPLGRKQNGPKSVFTDANIYLHQLLLYPTLKMGLTVASA